MKRKVLSLALVLALCLSLAVPALAAEEPSTFKNATVCVTNVIDEGTLDAAGTPSGYGGMITGSCTCVAPVTVTPDAKFGDTIEWFIAVYPEVLPEDGDVSDLDWDTYEGYTGKDLTLTEPGTYSVGFASESTDALCNFTVEILASMDIKPSFSDVKDSDYFAEPVQWAVEKKITDGTGKGQFSPNQTCNQAQILTFLWRAKGEPAPAGTVGGTAYYDAAAQWAHEQGLLEEFTADDPCTRAMVVTYLWKLAGSPAAKAADFSDVAADADYAQAVSWAVETGVTEGTGNNTFSPDKTCTRGQIVTFLYRALGK